ncbi:MAG: PAS domain S-box protein [Acidobacteriota bacterium]
MKKGNPGQTFQHQPPHPNDELRLQNVVPQIDWRMMRDTDHFVQFYESDRFLLNSLSGFISAGINADESCIIITNKNRLDALEETLKATGYDLKSLMASGRYFPVDVVEALSGFMVNGAPDPLRFTEIFGSLITKASTGNRHARVFGDMVATLCNEGNHPAALALEALWNNLRNAQTFTLFCAYPLSGFGHDLLGESLMRICGEHSLIIPAESYSTLPDHQERLLSIIQLQQKALSLTAETAQRQAIEKRLHATENRFRKFFEMSQEGKVFVEAQTGKILDANPFFSNLMGLSREELIGKTLWAIGIIDNPDAYNHLLFEVSKNRTAHYEYSLISPGDKSRLELEIFSSFFETDNPRVLQFTIHDITRQQQVENLSSHLAAIVESSDDAIISKTLDGIILSWNQSAVRIFGYTAEEVIGKPISMLIPPDRIDEEPAILERIKREERIDHYETVRIRKDGRLINISLTVSPVKDRRGKIIAASKIARDITARKQAEETIGLLMRISEKLNSTLEINSLLEVLVVEAAKLVRAESGVAGLYTPAGLTCQKYFHQGQWVALEYCWPAMHGLPGWLIVHKKPYLTNDALNDLQIIRELCVRFDVRQAISAPIMNAHKEILGFFEIHNKRDGSEFTESDLQQLMAVAQSAAVAIQNALAYGEIQRAEEQRRTALAREQEARIRAEEASQLKDVFLATVSHELRTPLNAIIGWTHMLRNDRLNEAGKTRALETIERNAWAQARLVEDILDVSRIITGKLRLNIGAVDLATVINEAIDAVQLAADSKGIQLEVRISPQARHLSGDASRLQQVIWNLLSNAIKFTPAGGRVEVCLDRIGSEIQITVSDSGQGIQPDFLPFIFDRFRQSDGTSTRAHGGLGLGLAIVRHLIEIHGGTVRADSAGEGQGATFTIKLPASSQERPSSSKRNSGSYMVYQELPSAPNAYPSIAPLKILLVDDDADTLHLLKIVLADHGANVQTASSASEALEILKHFHPHVVVSDLAMPGEDGYSLINKLRTSEDENQRKVPAVALTAYVRLEDRLRALSAGFNMFVPKPVEVGELITAITNLTEPLEITVS